MAPSPYIFIISICPVDMNKYARFDEIPSMTLKDIKESDGRTDGGTDRWTDGRENSIPTHKHSLRGYNYRDISKLSKIYAFLSFQYQPQIFPFQLYVRCKVGIIYVFLQGFHTLMKVKFPDFSLTFP